MFEAVSLVFSQSFLTRAFLVGVLISLCCALLGVSLVLKRFSMIGDGLSHVGFGSMAIACAANIAPLYFSLPIVLISAFFLLRLNEKGKIKGDAAIALISTGALAVGVMVTSMTTGMNVDIYNYMFGSILTMSSGDVVISAVVSVVVSILFVLFYNEIFAVTFDESFAHATGTKTSFYNMLIAGLTAVTIVIGMRMMGALLISSLIIFPAVTAMRICKSFRSVVISSALISVICFILGLIFSIEYEAPTGASIVCVNIIFLLLFSFIGKISVKTGSSVTTRIIAFLSAIVLMSVFFVLPFNSDKNNAKKDSLSIVTVGFAEYDFARALTEGRAEVTMLLSPGEESHTYEPTPSDIVKIEQSDIFICTGGESESWVNRILGSIDSEITVVRMIEICNLEKSEGEHDNNHDNHEDEHGEYDEHVWTSPANALLITEKITDTLCAVDPDNSDSYRSAFKVYSMKLNKLNKAFSELGEKATKSYVVIGDRFPLRYLMLEYGIEYHSVYPGCSAQTEVNPVRIAELNNMIINDSISTVFKVDLSTGTVAYSISEETGAKVDTLYSCHVISADDFNSDETYLSLMKRNYNALKNALM